MKECQECLLSTNSHRYIPILLFYFLIVIYYSLRFFIILTLSVSVWIISSHLIVCCKALNDFHSISYRKLRSLRYFNPNWSMFCETKYSLPPPFHFPSNGEHLRLSHRTLGDLWVLFDSPQLYLQNGAYLLDVRLPHPFHYLHFSIRLKNPYWKSFIGWPCFYNQWRYRMTFERRIMLYFLVDSIITYQNILDSCLIRN